MDHLLGMQLEASYRREVAYRWAEQRNLRRMAVARGPQEMVPAAIEPLRRRSSPGQHVIGWFGRHVRRAATAWSSG